MSIQVVYKKLKGESCTLEDLAELEPALAAGLQALLDYEGDVASTFQATFSISYELFGEIHNVNLRTGKKDDTYVSMNDEGVEIIMPVENEIVTNETRKEYVELYVTWMLDRAIAQQFDAFSKGFRKVCGGVALDLFEAEELELLVCGSQVLDFEDLKRSTKYEDGFDQSSRTVKEFWEIVLEMNEDEKRQFLKFISGRYGKQ